MNATIHVVPAYGRDYKNKASIQEDIRAGKDFLIQDISSKDDGRYINNKDAKQAGIQTFMVRYDGLRKQGPFPVA